MSSFNTPPPPPFGASRWEQRAWRRQVKAANRQARWHIAQQRLQERAARKVLRAQARLARRHSFAAPLVLLILGGLFLLGEVGRVAFSTLAGWYSQWWPLLLIGIGAVLLAEWAYDNREALPGTPPQRRTLGFLGSLIVGAIILTGTGSMAALHGATWARDHVNPDYQFGGLESLFGHSGSDTASSDSTVAPNGRLLIRNLRGAININGASTDGKIHLLTKRQAHGWDDDQTSHRLAQLTPIFDGDDQQRTLTVPEVQSGSADLELSVPREVTLELEGRSGKLTVSQVHAPVTLTVGSGGADLTGVTGRVLLTMNSDEGDVTAHSVTGDLSLEGHAGDITLSDVRGTVNLRGSFFGTTQLERIDGPTHFQTSRTDVQAARIDGDLTIESGSDLNATHLAGPVAIVTHNRNLTLDGVNGPVDVQNDNGSVTVETVSPVATIRIQNKNGDTELGMPENAAATLTLAARNGEISNDFDLKNGGSEDNPTLNANLKGGGPTVNVTVFNGNLNLKKSEAAPWTHDPAPKITPDPAPTPTKPATRAAIDEGADAAETA